MFIYGWWTKRTLKRRRYRQWKGTHIPALYCCRRGRWLPLNQNSPTKPYSPIGQILIFMHLAPPKSKCPTWAGSLVLSWAWSPALHILHLVLDVFLLDVNELELPIVELEAAVEIALTGGLALLDLMEGIEASNYDRGWRGRDWASVLSVSVLHLPLSSSLSLSLAPRFLAFRFSFHT